MELTNELNGGEWLFHLDEEIKMGDEFYPDDEWRKKELEKYERRDSLEKNRIKKIRLLICEVENEFVCTRCFCDLHSNIKHHGNWYELCFEFKSRNYLSFLCHSSGSIGIKFCKDNMEVELDCIYFEDLELDEKNTTIYIFLQIIMRLFLLERLDDVLFELRKEKIERVLFSEYKNNTKWFQEMKRKYL